MVCPRPRRNRHRHAHRPADGAAGGDRPSRPRIALAVLALSGIARGIVLAYAQFVIGTPTTATVVTHFVSAFASVIVVMPLATLIVDGIRRHRDVMRSLQFELEQERALGEHSRQILRDRRDALVNRVYQTVADQLDRAVDATSDPAAAAAHVQEVTTYVLRPLVSELRGRGVEDDRLLAVARVRMPSAPSPVRSHASGLFTERPYSPALSVLLLGTVVGPETLNRIGLVHGTIWLTVGLGWIFGVLVLAERHLPRSPVLVTFAWLVAATGAGVSGSLATLPPYTPADPLSVFMLFAGATLIGIIGPAFTWVVVAHLDSAEAELRAATERTTLATALLRQQAWMEQQELGRIVHRDVQARLVALALRLQVDGDIDITSVVTAELTAISGLLQPGTQESNWRKQCEDMQTLWGFALDFSLNISLEAATAMDADAVAGWAFGEITREAITNAVRHAGASTVVVQATAGRDELLLSVTDDGVSQHESDTPGTRGFGSRTMDELSSGWSLRNRGYGHELHARIATRGLMTAPTLGGHHDSA